MQHHSFFRNLPPFIHCSYIGEVMQWVAKTTQKTLYIFLQNLKMMGMVLQLKATRTFYGACQVGTKSPPFFYSQAQNPCNGYLTYYPSHSFKCMYQMHGVSVNSTQHCISFLPVTQHLEIKRTKKSVVIHSQKECKWKLVGVMIQFSTLIPTSTSLHFVLVNIKSPTILKKCSYCLIVYFTVVS